MERYWLEITIEAVSVLAEMSGEILIEAGCGGVVCHDPPAGKDRPSARSYRVTGYLPLQDGCDRKVGRIRARLAGLDRYFPPGPDEPYPRTRVFLRRVKEENWGENWKKYFQPQFIDSLIITAPWHEVPVAPGQVVVKIDPGMAFGTGTHPSTILSLRLLQEVIRGGETVYDIGTGSGILALAAAGLGAAQVIGVDLDPVAVEEARRNVRRNRMNGRVRVVRGNLLENLEPGADLVVINIIAETIIDVLPRLPRFLNPGGRVIGSGIIFSRAHEVKEAVLAAGLEYQKEITEEGWVACLAGRACGRA
ncbi:MAG TPA: 50S ribosomal protein L11 methyltransferase [Firmicutes bacterium]|jgi:ribosomal protein L11 methyltransferase|nr:50S ribosomal protein L11 methyltransferase [Bacillota bacterium]